MPAGPEQPFEAEAAATVEWPPITSQDDDVHTPDVQSVVRVQG
jgi:hypothetical protein